MFFGNCHGYDFGKISLLIVKYLRISFPRWIWTWFCVFCSYLCDILCADFPKQLPFFLKNVYYLFLWWKMFMFSFSGRKFQQNHFLGMNYGLLDAVEKFLLRWDQKLKNFCTSNKISQNSRKGIWSWKRPKNFLRKTLKNS